MQGSCNMKSVEVGFRKVLVTCNRKTANEEFCKAPIRCDVETAIKRFPRIHCTYNTKIAEEGACMVRSSHYVEKKTGKGFLKIGATAM